MKDTIGTIRANFFQNIGLNVLSVAVGVSLSVLFPKYIGWFIIVAVGMGGFFIIYFKWIEKAECIAQALEHIYGKFSGDISFIDDPRVFYNEGQKLIEGAKYEILIYNDYFGQATAVLGFNTSDEYFEALNKKIKSICSHDEFRYVCVIGVDEKVPIRLSEKFINHISFISDLRTTGNSQQILPLRRVSSRLFYFSFTIIDGTFLRIALEGRYSGEGDVKSKVIGGFIIRDNKQIIDRFKSQFLAMNAMSDNVLPNDVFGSHEVQELVDALAQ